MNNLNDNNSTDSTENINQYKVIIIHILRYNRN